MKEQQKPNVMIDPRPLKQIGHFIFNFRQLLGEGSFSKVYKGYDQRTNEEVAVKLINLESLKSKALQELLTSEIQVLQNIHHPQVLKCHEIYYSQKNCYIITELCNQGSLEQKIKNQGYLYEKEAESIVRDVYDGLRYLAQNKIVHRDLKIANVFMHDGRAKIADFGFARYSSCNFKDISIGSPLYMSPEGYINNIYGPKTDVWSLGIFVYELLHGTTPYSVCQTDHDLYKALKSPITADKLKSQLSPAIKAFIVKCLQIDEFKRPTMEELAYTPYLRALYKKETFEASQQQESKKVSKDNKCFKLFNSHQQTQNKVDKDKNLHIGSFHSKQSTQQEIARPFSPPKNSQSPLKALGQHKAQKKQHKKVDLRGQQGLPVAENCILKGYLTFKECVSLLHYGRLLFKFILLCRLELPTESILMQTFAKWLMQLINQMLAKVESRQIRYDQHNIETQEDKLKEVCLEYSRKYRSDLSVLLSQDGPQKYSLQFMKYYCYGQYLKINKLITPQTTVPILLMGHMIVLICETTSLLARCFEKQNYQLIQDHRHPEIFLKEEKDYVCFESYLTIRQKMYHF